MRAAVRHDLLIGTDGDEPAIANRRGLRRGAAIVLGGNAAVVNQ
jgi:hypothetical protein